MALLAAIPQLRGLILDEGQLVIETRLPNVLVEVKRAGRTVALIDTEVGPALTLKAGTYELGLPGPPGEQELSADRVTLRRGERRVVAVKPAPKVDVLASPPDPVETWPSVAEGEDVLPGLIPRPARRPGLGRWQVQTKRPHMPVTSLAWSPDGRLVACAAGDRVVRVYDANRLELVGLWVGHTARVLAVAWSPDGRHLASGSEDATVRIWDADGTPVRALQGHSAAVLAVAWSPDSKSLASAGYDTVVRLWGEDGTPGPVLQGLASAARTLAWSPDGTRIASGGNGIYVWTIDGKPVSTPVGNPGTIFCVTWSPDRRWLASGSDEGPIRLWGAGGADGKNLGRSPGGRAVAWSPDGRWLVSAGPGALVQLWDTGGRPGPTFRGHHKGIYSVAWHPDGKRLASGGDDATVRLWDVSGRAGPTLPPNDGPVSAISWSPDGERLVWGGQDGVLRCWRTGTLDAEWVAIPTSPVDVVVFSGTGQVLSETPGIKGDIVYLVERPGGVVEILAPDAFRKRVSAGEASLGGSGADAPATGAHPPR